MKKINFSFNYLITQYDWSFHFIPSLVVWKPCDYAYEISAGFLLWEFNVLISTIKK